MEIIKKDGKREKFSSEKLIRTIKRSMSEDQDLSENDLALFLKNIKSNAYSGITTDEIHILLIDHAKQQGKKENNRTLLEISNQLIMNDLHHIESRPFEKVAKISNVTKRSGYKAPMDLSKIVDKAYWATDGIPGVSASELVIDSHISWKEGITTDELQKAIIKTAVDKISEPYANWTYVAARLLLDSMYHQVGKIYGTKKGNPYPSLKQYIEFALTTGKYHKNFFKGYDLNDLNAYIKPERDLQFTYLGLVTFRDRYSVHTGDGKQIELPQHMFMAIAMFLAQKEKDKQFWAKKFYDLISSFDAMAATPTLSNARLTNHQLSSCFVGSNDDSLTGIFDGYKEKAFLSKLGGGVGWDWSQVRASDSSIDAYEGVAKGLTPFIKIENDIALAVDQLGCVAKNSYVKVLKTVETNNFTHDFRREYEKIELTKRELIEGVASYASKFAFEYGKFSKNFIRSLIFDYVLNTNGHRFLEETYGLSHDQYKKIIGRYKKINKGLPEGFQKIIGHEDYAISREGVVINCITLRPLSSNIDRKGYVRVTLGKQGNALHLLLAKQYLGFTDGQTVDHDDGNKLNNSLSNLQLISNEDNISKGWKTSKIKRTEKNRIRKHLSYGYRLKGDKRNTHDFEILNIETINVPIEKLRIGDLVLSYNIEKNTPEFKTVVAKHTIDVKKDDQIKLSFEDGNYIVTSNWHPFPRVTNGKVVYVRSDEMKEGDITINHKGDFVKVASVENGDADEEFVDLTVKDNNNYFCSTCHDDGNFHLIHNTRKGAFANYVPDWHMDIYLFIKMRDNGGEERHRAQDIFPAIWYSDEFMLREMNDEMWTLFDPYDVPYLNELYGDEFTEAYKRAEADPSIRKVRVRARELFAEIMQSAYKHGVPFACFKDTANKEHKNKHVGMIRSSNLCTEIFQATEPEREMYDITLEDGVVINMSEFETILTGDGSKRVKNLIVGDTIDGLSVEDIRQYRSEGKTAICNLASVNLPRMTNLPDDEFYEKIYTAIRMLDNVIDVNLYPTEKIERTAKLSRAIGLGVMGEAEDIACRGIHFGSKEHAEYIEEQYSRFQAASISASERLAREKGPYPDWEGSEWPNPMRNGYINAIAPTSSISILTGTSSCFEPVFNRSWYEDNLSGVTPVTAPNLSVQNYEFYRSAYNVNQESSIEMHGIRSKYIDQGGSFNIFLKPGNHIDVKYLASLYRQAWMSGLKSVYYVRSSAPEDSSLEIIDRSMECAGCQ